MFKQGDLVAYATKDWNEAGQVKEKCISSIIVTTKLGEVL